MDYHRKDLVVDNMATSLAFSTYFYADKLEYYMGIFVYKALMFYKINELNLKDFKEKTFSIFRREYCTPVTLDAETILSRGNSSL